LSAAALHSLASAAAATIYDAIGVAETNAELDELAKLFGSAIWSARLATMMPNTFSSTSSAAVRYSVTRPSRGHFRASQSRNRICGASEGTVAAFHGAASNGRRTSRLHMSADIYSPSPGSCHVISPPD
jgi:hypothetical protein